MSKARLMKQRKPRKKKRNITRNDTNELAGTRKIRGKKEAERAGKRTQKQHIPMVICVVGESNSVLSRLGAAFLHYVMMSTTLTTVLFHFLFKFQHISTHFHNKNTMTTVAPFSGLTWTFVFQPSPRCFIVDVITWRS